VYFERPLEKICRTVLVSQNTIENNGPRAGALHKQLRWKCRFALVSWRSAGLPLARGPIRRNKSNRLKTGPGDKVNAVLTSKNQCSVVVTLA